MGNERISEFLPGGRNKTIAGGTRTRLNLKRPWQMPLSDIIKPATCPFETKPQDEYFVNLPGIPKDWKVLTNPYTPHLDHLLVIPEKCWDAEKLSLLGGPVNIFFAFQACQIALSHFHSGDGKEMAILVNVGWLGGQNLGHPHFHLFDAEVEAPLEPEEAVRVINPMEIIGDDGGTFLVTTGGAGTGECLILPRRKILFEKCLSALATMLGDTVGLCRDKFRSTDKGLPPDFSVVVRIAGDGSLRYASYRPFLAPWGALQYVVAPLEGGSIVLQWPHGVTARYLRGEE